MREFKAALFDLDGTLVDNYAAIHKCLEISFKKFGVEAPSFGDVYKAVGGSILITIQKLLPEQKQSLADCIGSHYLKIFPDYLFYGLEPMPYARDVLKALRARGFKLACFTNKQQDGAETILKSLDMAGDLDAVIGTTLKSARKPSKEFSQAALDRLCVSADECVGVGDSKYDYMAAEAVGMPSAIVATGADSRPWLAENCPNSLGVFENLKDLSAAVFDIAL